MRRIGDGGENNTRQKRIRCLGVKRRGGGNDEYNGEYRHCHPPYSSYSRLEANAAEDTTRQLKEVSK